MQHGEYECVKCNCKGYETSQFVAPQGGLQSVIDVESAGFHTVSCVECGYTKLYKGTETSAAGKILVSQFLVRLPAKPTALVSRSVWH